MDYLYDETYEGFLTCVYAHYYLEKADGIYPEKEYQSQMLKSFQVIESDNAKASRVYEAVGRKMGGEGMKLIYRSFLANAQGKENAILQYLIYGFRIGRKINGLYTHPLVLPLRRMEQDVKCESHRLLGLLRFCEMKREQGGQILYADLTPDHDVIELMADHFADRYKNEAFIIHDKKRQKAVFYSGGDWDIRFLDGDFKLQAKENGWISQTDYERLWKNYFQTMAIKERTNPKCQRSYMPARYWKNMPEFRQDL